MKWNEATKAQQGNARRLADRAAKVGLHKAVIGGHECNATVSQIIQNLDAWEAAIVAAEAPTRG